MAFVNINSNHGSTLHTHIIKGYMHSSILNQGIRNYTSSVLKKTQPDQILTKITNSFANLKESFVKKSKEDNENAYMLQKKITNPLNDQCFCVGLNKFTNIHSKLTDTIRMENIKSRNSYLQPTVRCAHLFNHIRFFRTERTPRKRSILPKDFFSFGFLSSKSKYQIKHDLNSFYKDLNKENLPPEQNQRALLAFVEGYVTGKETLLNQVPRWGFFRLISTGLTIWLLYFLYKSGNFVFGQMLETSDATIEESNVKFDDVKGADEAKQELKNVVEFLKNPEKFSSLGGKLPKGVLLVGPPGTGKTLLAKAVAGEAQVPFFSKSGPEFDEVYVGVGAKRIRDLFKLAKENVPCVIFIDEIDSVGKERTSSSQHPHANDTINQLLTEMDGFRSNSGIIVLGATNRKDDLDRALLRPGRFDVEVNVAIPDYVGRKELFDHYLSRVRHIDVNVEKLARGTTNFTGADIENTVNQAALRAALLGAKYVTTEHIEYARDKALMGPEKLSKILDEETNKITAYHEGGHTVVAYFTEHAQPLHKVTIIARGASLGHTSYIPDKDIYHVTKTQLLAMIDTMMGGRAAEELIFGTEKITSGASSDLQKATDLASKMVRRWGMSDEVGLTTYNNQTVMSPQTANVIDMEVKRILNESYERAKNILMTHKDRHRELSEALIKYETLDAEEINTIMKGDPIKRPGGQ